MCSFISCFSFIFASFIMQMAFSVSNIKFCRLGTSFWFYRQILQLILHNFKFYLFVLYVKTFFILPLLFHNVSEIGLASKKISFFINQTDFQNQLHLELQQHCLPILVIFFITVFVNFVVLFQLFNIISINYKSCYKFSSTLTYTVLMSCNQ